MIGTCSTVRTTPATAGVVPVAAPVRLSHDRKVSPLIRRGAKDAPLLGNTFGLPAGLSCPGRTEFCDGCYAESTETQWSAVSALVRANYDALTACGGDVSAMADILADAVAEWHRKARKAVESVRLSARDAFIFRIHWDGDFFSVPYARAWARVMADYPSVTFWAYTRTFEAVRVLAAVPNLTLYLSVDRYNVARARGYLRRYPTVHAAWCADTIDEARTLADRVGRHALACPENVGRLPLVVAMSGKRTETVNPGDDAQGACAACRLCVDGVRDVMFSVKGR